MNKNVNTIMLAIACTAIDGNIADEEVEAIGKWKFFNQCLEEGVVSQAMDQMKNENSINDACKALSGESDEFKSNLLKGLIWLIVADQVVEDIELKYLNHVANGLGLTPAHDKVMNTLNEYKSLLNSGDLESHLI